MASDSPTRRLMNRWEAVYARMNAASGGRLGILRRAYEGFTAAHGARASASLAYYGLFSLFPMLVLLVTVLGLLVDRNRAQEVVALAAQQILPGAKDVQEFVFNTVSRVFAARGEITIVSLLALAWAASGAFTALTYNIDLAWSEARKPSPLKARLVGLLMVLISYALLVLLLIFSALLSLLTVLPAAVVNGLGFYGRVAGVGIVRLGWFAVDAAVFVGLYRWLPRIRVPWSVAFWTGLLVAGAIQALNLCFTWYLGSRFARYELLYGPLTTIIILMLWFYLAMVVILFGAHLCASLAHFRDRRRDAGVRSSHIAPERSAK